MPQMQDWANLVDNSSAIPQVVAQSLGTAPAMTNLNTIQANTSAVTATTDGATTGVIPAGALNVLVTSSASSKIVTLPAPTPGITIKIKCTANGYKLQSSDKSNVKINNVADGSKVLTVSAGNLLIAECFDATNWYIWMLDNLGAPQTAGVPA